MRVKRTFAGLVLFGLLVALAIPLTAAADSCPPENPCIEPPQSIEVNPDPRHADGSLVELPEPGLLSPQLIPMPLPRRVDPLPVAMRYQDPGDLTCGVQALGMALEGLDSSAPSSDSLLTFLKDNNMLYDFGTGVEELAFAAQSFGFEGSLAFHDWTLDDLQTELDAGRPIVVALGEGHFVTVTGISPDGGWIAVNDPTLGEQILSAEEFLRLWSMQGSSGVAVGVESPVPGLGLMPWVAFLAGLMALITQTPLALRRKGIGGSLDPGGATDGRGPTPPGSRWVFKEMPRYEMQEVQEWQVVSKTVPNMVRVYKPVGWTTETERIPLFKTVLVQDGWTYTYERVATYRTERYIRYWRTTYINRATYRYVRGRRIFAGYRRVARRMPVHGTRRVFSGWSTQRKRVPRMVERTVPAGYKVVEKRVPKYGWVEEQDGWTTETERIPHMVQKQVQVGTEWRWVLAKMPEPVVVAEDPPSANTEAEDTTAAIEGHIPPPMFNDPQPDELFVSSEFSAQFDDGLVPTIIDAALLLLNAIGTILVATGVFTEVGIVLLGVNILAQIAQILVDNVKLQNGEISQEHFNFNRTMNVLDMVPGLGTLSGTLSLMNTGVFSWAFRWSADSPDNR